jgi:hypothetical protein
LRAPSSWCRRPAGQACLRSDGKIKIYLPSKFGLFRHRFSSIEPLFPTAKPV